MISQGDWMTGNFHGIVYRPTVERFDLFVGSSWGQNYHLLKEDKSLCGLEGQFVNVKKLDWLTEGLVSCEKCKETLKFMREL